MLCTKNFFSYLQYFFPSNAPSVERGRTEKIVSAPPRGVLARSYFPRVFFFFNFASDLDELKTKKSVCRQIKVYVKLFPFS